MIEWLGTTTLAPGDIEVPAFPGVKRLSSQDWLALETVAVRIGTSVNCLAGVMSLESGFRPYIVNPKSGATGLIQFMPWTAKSFGTTLAVLARMSFQGQLVYVERFYKKWHRHDLFDCGQLYLATFTPAHLGKEDDYVIFTEGEKGYDWNAPLDSDGDGTITAGDVRGWGRRRSKPSGTVVLSPRVAKKSFGKVLALGAAAVAGYFAVRWL